RNGQGACRKRGAVRGDVKRNSSCRGSGGSRSDELRNDSSYSSGQGRPIPEHDPFPLGMRLLSALRQKHLKEEIIRIETRGSRSPLHPLPQGLGLRQFSECFSLFSLLYKVVCNSFLLSGFPSLFAMMAVLTK